MLAHDDDSAAPDEGAGVAAQVILNATQQSIYREIGEFQLLQRHVAMLEFAALQAAERIAQAAAHAIDFAGIQAAHDAITTSISQSINFSTLQASAALLRNGAVDSLGETVREWVDSLYQSIDVAALHNAQAAALAGVDLLAVGHAQQAATAAIAAAFSHQADLVQEALSRVWRDGIDWQQMRERLSRWIPLNLRDIADLAAVAQLSLDEGLPLAWVPRRPIVEALLTSDTPQERALILDERLTDILDDCEFALVDITHEWARECRVAISALRAGFDGPAQSHAGNIIDSIVLRLLGRNGRDRAKARAEASFDDLPFQLASESLTLRPLHQAFAPWWPDRGARPPDHFARHATAHAVGHPGLFHRRHALTAVMLATSLTVQFWEYDVDAGQNSTAC